MANLCCPFLGLVDDPETCKLFPSGYNCCHGAKPVEAVALTHQTAYCLSTQHFRCPVFVSQVTMPLPAELRATPRRWENWRWGAVSLAAFALVLFLAMFAWRSGFPQAGLRMQPEYTTSTTAAFSAPTAAPSTTATLEPSPLSRPPTLAAAPTVSATALPSPVVSATICRPPAGWVPYLVRAGDTLYRLSVYYGVLTSELQNANCMGQSVHLVAGRSLYVPNQPSPAPIMDATLATRPGHTQEPAPTETLSPLPSNTPTPPAPADTATFTVPAPTDTMPAAIPTETAPLPTRDMPPP